MPIRIEEDWELESLPEVNFYNPTSPVYGLEDSLNLDYFSPVTYDPVSPSGALISPPVSPVFKAMEEEDYNDMPPLEIGW